MTTTRVRTTPDMLRYALFRFKVLVGHCLFLQAAPGLNYHSVKVKSDKDATDKEQTESELDKLYSKVGLPYFLADFTMLSVRIVTTCKCRRFVSQIHCTPCRFVVVVRVEESKTLHSPDRRQWNWSNQ